MVVVVHRRREGGGRQHTANLHLDPAVDVDLLWCTLLVVRASMARDHGLL